MPQGVSMIYATPPTWLPKPKPKPPQTWQGCNAYRATLGGVRITVWAPDKGEALLAIWAIAVEYDLA